MGLDHPAPFHGRLISIGIAAALAIAGSAAAQTCEGFPPWTITATPISGATALIRICGTYSGCRPHNPSATVVGSTIQLTLVGGEAPDRCQCTAVVGPFEESLVVSLPHQGEYTVEAIFRDCFEVTDVGSASFVFGGAATVPALDPRGIAAMVVLMAAVAAWRLRR